MSASDDNFFSRWSRRKVQVRDGAPVPAVPTALAESAAALAPPAPVVAPLVAVDSAPPAEPAAAPAPTPPTLDDVAALSRDSDYTRFVAQGVTPDVKNAALKKLFTDPHFNVMDGLDIYIDDYSKPDPLPPGMLRQMVQSQFLRLFDDDEPAQPAPDGADSAAPAAVVEDAVAVASLDADPTATAIAAATATVTALPFAPAPDEDTDLQLQPDAAAGRSGPEPGPGPDARRQH